MKTNEEQTKIKKSHYSVSYLNVFDWFSWFISRSETVIQQGFGIPNFFRLSHDRRIFLMYFQHVFFQHCGISKMLSILLWKIP